MLRVISSERFHKYLFVSLSINGEVISINTTHTAVKMFIDDLEEKEIEVNERVLRLVRYNELDELFKDTDRLEKFAQEYVSMYSQCNPCFYLI